MPASSSEDVFYSAPESPSPNPNSSQDHHQPLSTPPNPNPHYRADQNQSPPDTWFLRVASSAGKVISSVLGLSDGSSSDDESEADVSDAVCSPEEKDEFVERINEPKQGMASSQVEEPKTVMSITRSDVTVDELVMQETLSRKQSEKQINPLQSQRVESSSSFVTSHNQLVHMPLSPVQASLEIKSVAVAKAKNWSEENKCTSSSWAMPLNPDTFPSPGNTQLPLASKKSPLNPDPKHCLSPGQSQQQPSSKIIPPALNPDPKHCLSPGQSQQQPSSKIIPPVSPLPFPSPSPDQYQQPPVSNIIPPVNPVSSPSLDQNRQQPSHSAPPLNPNSNLSCTSPKQSSSCSSPVMSYPEKQSKPCSKRDKPEPKCHVTSSKSREVLKKKDTPSLISDPMDEERSGNKRMPSNLKEVVELFSGDLDYKQLADMDLLDILEMKGIKFEDPPWWPK